GDILAHINIGFKERFPVRMTDDLHHLDRLQFENVNHTGDRRVAQIMPVEIRDPGARAEVLKTAARVDREEAILATRPGLKIGRQSLVKRAGDRYRPPDRLVALVRGSPKNPAGQVEIPEGERELLAAAHSGLKGHRDPEGEFLGSRFP